MDQSLLINHSSGFLPLRSYFESKKDKAAAKRRVPRIKKKELVRSLI